MARAQSASDDAYIQVKEMIVTGTLPGGELVSEGDIAQQLGMSRTPVREAFLRLQVQGWMRLFPKRGALVLPISPGEAEHVIAARRIVEAGSIRAIAAQPDRAEELAVLLHAEIVRQHRVAKSGDISEFSAADADFHHAIVRAAGNPLLDEFYLGLRERQRRMTVESLDRRPGQVDGIIEDHTNLIKLIRAADVEGYDSAVDLHMRRVHGLDTGVRR
ncbi:GntR family transcriptional regulator [Rhodococcus sp. 06-418-1B]|nr:GntR family transcriptional regulator [Rhodococcus sp. 06-418-1B]OZC92977.1 GntR family transcriptional regulator [Rhodococcus sp. 06-418-1B]